MEIFNLLASISMFGETYDVSLNWIARIIRWLISSVGSGVGMVGVGIILFSLVLKLVVLPFDVYQRISMRKQNQKMKDQQERMEKLQKQYANDKQMYNQKLMEMYKENGISMFSSCLPMILSMVIFIVAINAFNAYARYSAIDNYNYMVGAYTAEIRSYCPDIEKENIALKGDKIIVDNADAYIYYQLEKPETVTEVNDDLVTYINARLDSTTTEYVIKADKVKANADMNAAIQEMLTNGLAEDEDAALNNYFVGKAQDAVKVAYEDEENGVVSKTKFLWIKNIWMTDASYKHPILSGTEFVNEAKNGDVEFSVNGEDISYSDIGKTGTNVYDEEAYNRITGKLTVQKEAANGYYILIALSIGTILLQQFVMMRSQKEQQKYSTVDGQGASQQKMMMIIMTGMFAVFSFMYSAAFSIYMITSNVFSMLSTLIINKFVDKKLAKEEASATVVRMDNRTLSRIEAAKNAGKASAQDTREKKEKEDKE